MAHDPIVIEAGRNGPPTSGHGGWSAGLLARLIDGPAAVALRAAPPLDTPLTVVEQPDGVLHLTHGDTLVADARPADTTVSLPRPVSWDEALAAHHTFEHEMADHHPFPTCFGCGTHRNPADALRLFSGIVPEGDLVAAPWHVADICHQGAVTEELMWGAIDCPTGWAAMSLLAVDGVVAPSVLATMTVRIDALPAFGDHCVVAAWPLRSDGRKRFTAGAILSPDGSVLAVAQALWIELKPVSADRSSPPPTSTD